MPKDGWVELRGGTASQSSALLDASHGASRRRMSSEGGIIPVDGRVTAGGPIGGSSYPGSFVMGNVRRGGLEKGRVFGVPLEELVLNPKRWGGRV